MSNIRVIVPITWNDPLRPILLETFKKLGYTWSGGDSLDSDWPRLHDMAYIAIHLEPLVLSFSTHISIIEKFESKLGYNYVVVDPTIERVISSINFISKLLKEIGEDERQLQAFVRTHHELKDKIKLLS